MRNTVLIVSFVFAAYSLQGQGIITSMAGTGFPGFSGDGGAASVAQLYTPQNAAVDTTGTIYFADGNNHRIRRITPDGIITTIAGNGIEGTAGDGGPALSASLGRVYQVAISPDGGHLCFGDYDAYKIRCITLSSGIIQGYGTGQPTSAGDGGPVANASFYFPRGAAFDSAGNFYLADYAANRIRRVDAITGIVTTLAGGNNSSLGDGGPANLASLSFPSGLQCSNGALYIADQGNWRVRRVDLSTNIISTVAGNGSPYSSGDGGPALMAGMTPEWVTLDAAGDLFLTDSTRVRMVDTTGIIQTIAGSGNSGWGYDDIPATQTVFAGIDGVAWDATRQRVLISDYGDRIRQIFFTPATTTALDVSPNPSGAGQPITLHASVSPVGATGSVRFHNGYQVLGSAPVAQGSATFSWTPPGTGAFGLYAVYGGDANDNLSSSSTITVTVKTQSSTTLASTPNPSTVGVPVALTATVQPTSASGSVQFYAAGSLLGSATLANGQAQLTISTLPAGADSLTAVYSGDAYDTGSTSAVVVQSVKALTTTALASSPNPSTFATAVTLTAIVTPAAATGYVQFFNGSVSLGSVALSGGKASLPVSGLPAGTDSLTAVYGGDGNYASSTSGTVTQTVNKANSSTSLAASATQVNSGQSVTFTAKVTPSAATGVVQFLDGSTVIGTAPLAGGTAVFSTSSLTTANHVVQARYGGDTNMNSSQSNTVSVRVKH